MLQCLKMLISVVVFLATILNLADIIYDTQITGAWGQQPFFGEYFLFKILFCEYFLFLYPIGTLMCMSNLVLVHFIHFHITPYFLSNTIKVFSLLVLLGHKQKLYISVSCYQLKTNRVGRLAI